MYKEKIETCSQRIKIALELRKMKQAELCNLTKIPKSSLSLYLSGAYEPKQDRLADMAIALKVSEAWLRGYDVPMIGGESISSEKIELSESEKEMLLLFRQIPESQQKVLIQMIRGGLDTK